MTTAALLPTPGDPLLARYWCRNYERVWRGEVDELRVLVNGDPAGAEVYRAVGAQVIVHDRRIGHGEAMAELIHSTNAAAVVFVEDDAFVRHTGAICNRLEGVLSGQFDIIGCPRGGMDPAIAVAAAEKWGTITGPDGSTGHGLWPAFLFGRTADLRAVANGFASRSWQAGDVIPGLGYRVPHSMTTDTMSAAAFVLRDRLRITLDVNYKELDQKTFPGHAPWFHAGGLSNDPTSMRDGIPPESNEGRDWAHRLWWWRRIGHAYDPRGMDVDHWSPIIEPWINWRDI